MHRKQLRMGKCLRVALGNCRSPATEIVLPLGDAEGDPKSRHHGADQWPYVVSESATAKVNGKSYPLCARTLLLNDRHDKPEIRNTGLYDLRTLDCCMSPAYTKGGDLSPAGTTPALPPRARGVGDC